MWLTPFKVGKALWKLYTRDRLKSDEAKIIIELMQELIRYGSLRIIHVEDLMGIMDITLERKVIFYGFIVYVYVWIFDYLFCQYYIKY